MHVRELFNLSGKVAIVTGGSRGIGKEIATGLGEAGARVTITARREQWLTPACDELTSLGIDCLAVTADIASVEEVNRILADTLERWGRIDILVNNAGITWGTPPEDMPLDKWDAVIDTNARGTLICCQQVGKEMIKRGGGNIINIASTTGMLAVDPRVMQAIGYQASKAAIIVMTRQLAVEWARHDIRVNAIAPFFFTTRMTEAVTQRAEKELIQHIPMGRVGREGEIKGVALFLASEASRYITGQVINVDGGMSAW
ncbi:MAG: SDR family oxidoreductase [Chloroflexi bacterium]|nr:SDR family oxidoreductase [Chloroflexota bacterium]